MYVYEVIHLVGFMFHEYLLCASSGHLEMVKLLVSRSADAICKDKRGYPPLHAAAASGQIEVVKYMLRLGAEVRVYIRLSRQQGLQQICLCSVTSCANYFL